METVLYELCMDGTDSNGEYHLKKHTLVYDNEKRQVRENILSYSGTHDNNESDILEIPAGIETHGDLVDCIIRERPQWRSMLKKRSEYPLRNYMDVVFCIDGTSSMEGHLDRVKNIVLHFYKDVMNSCYARKKILKVRARLVLFRDYLCNGDDAMMETDFFEIPKEEDTFRKVLLSIEPKKAGSGLANGLEALAYAIKSDWNRNMRRRQVVVVFSDAPPHKIGHGSININYPKGMPSSFDELTSWWGNPHKKGFIDNPAKRMIIFAPDAAGWSDISDKWDNVIHFPSEAGKGIDDYDYECIINSIYSDI